MLKAFLNERFPLIETLDDSFFFATASYFLELSIFRIHLSQRQALNNYKNKWNIKTCSTY